MSLQKWVLFLGACVLLSACGSSVNLNDVPVEDRSGALATQQGRGAIGSDSSVVAKSTVDGTELGRARDAAGPVGGRIVYFDYDSFAIKPEFQSVIETHARFIKADRNRKVALEGHTDERGGREYNLALGQKRAEAVRRALALLGVADSQAEAVSFGKEKPAAVGSDEAAMAKNRRVELSYR